MQESHAEDLPSRPLSGQLIAEAKEIHRFSSLARNDEELARRLRACTSPEQIVALAESVGCRFSLDKLREESRLNLGAPFWPWVGQPRAWRKAFFGEAAPSPGQPSGSIPWESQGKRSL